MKREKAALQKTNRVRIKTNLKQKLRKSSLRVKRERDSEPTQVALRFSPTAWAKLLYFRDKSDNEVGGFGITEPDDLLYVKHFVTVKQKVSPISVSFDDEAVANFFEDQVDLGRKPEQFARLWLHTHPGSSPEPSFTDEETFTRVFGGCHWAIMCILAQDNHTYAELSFNVGPGGHVPSPVEVDYSRDFGPSDREKWDAEYKANIQVEKLSRCSGNGRRTPARAEFSDYALPYDFLDELEQMEPVERQFVLDELGARPDLWDEEEEVFSL